MTPGTCLVRWGTSGKEILFSPNRPLVSRTWSTQSGSEADDKDGEEDGEEDGEGGEPSPTRSEGWGQRERRRLRESTHCQSPEWEKRRDASEGVSGLMGRCIGRPGGT